MTKDANKKNWLAEKERIKKEIGQEMQQWEALEIHPARTISIDPFIMDNEIFSMWNFLVHKKIINEDEYWCFKQERLLKKLRETREEITPMVEEQKRAMLHEKLAAPPGIDVQKLLDGMQKKH